MTEGTILPGARVRTDDGLLGAVERVEQQEASDGTAYLLVRALDGSRLYRIPSGLVREIGQETEQAAAYTVARLGIGARELDQFLVGDRPPAARADDPTLTARIPLAAERLVAQIRPVRRGVVRVHKGVEAAEQVLTVPVAREEVIIERIPAEQYDAGAPVGPDETIIPVVEERLVVETRRVVTEYLRIRKRVVTEQQEVRGQVRREVVTIAEERDERAAPTSVPLLHGG